ncbi:cellulose biosynthesis cyclic di-GMP-binding regulatory protein BcsB [Delftia tsuruhatensis]|uniref:cellulose biosynthesis cyclic di-GMP-binding regulatory protein BcsB n=1 Tax=Delftia tsuruhatensis TaxID=180282 RepID=UPI0020910BA6|nr:cellulose biosynthesis cyclic di-GMP-binding regulatory protein BcsB [Delftia tsuruhatensis]MCO5335798.1 cellulose biosynthesis cyclic di-GMP-binding regulatory protein BcsB [Delftia tsuruhatensis]MCR4544231.1 cellulose biosynthesis cyclic di-GMP-binding regulatory protein BcsB [Delftia tsuruhatensis]
MQPTIHRHSFSRTGARWALGSLLGLGALFAQTASASALGDAIRQLGASDGLQRSVTLKELGIVDPVVLAGTATQDFYLPVPRGLPLGDASIAFDGRYLKGEPGTSTVVISLNGTPAVSQTVPDGEGTLQRNLPVAQPARASDFVRLGVNWRNRNNSQQRCDENHSLANSLTISPQTRLSYRVDPRDVRTIEDVWNTLPVRTTVLVSGRQLEQASFDSAWRIGASLQRNNRRMQVRALPAVGEVIDLRGLEVPAALAGVPAFAALRGAEPQHKLASDAELGALIMLGSAQVSGDIVVADKALQQRLTAAFAALQTQLAADPDAGQALQQWRARRAPLASEALASQQLRALPMGRQMVLAVASDAGARVAGLQEAALQRLLVSDNVTVAAAQPPQWDEAKGIRLSSLGGSPDSFDVLSRGEWTMNFPLSAVASQGRMPGEITLYVAAAPGASATRPVATLFWNGMLLSARQLDANGQPERLRARVPGYALGINNTLRVSVQRQPYSADCNEIPQPYPASVLPAISYVTPGKAEPNGSFIGLLPLLGARSQLLVPASYLSAAPAALERMANLAAASGLSASQAELVVAQADAPAKPSMPFVAMEVPVEGAKPLVTVTDGQQLRIRGKSLDWLDIKGLKQLSSAEVVTAGGQQGVLWRAIGEWTGGLGEPFLLNRGNIAVIGGDGPLAWLDSSNPDAGIPSGPREGAFHEWRNFLSWSVPGIAIALVVVVLLVLLAWAVARSKQPRH